MPIQLRYWLSSNPKLITSVLGIVIRSINRYYKKKAKEKGINAPETGAICFIQRFGSALNLNVHFHILYLDGAYSGKETPQFYALPPPKDREVQEVVERIYRRVVRHLQKQGYLRDDETESGENRDPLAEQNPLLASCVATSLQNKVALGKRAGQWIRKFYIPASGNERPKPKCAGLKGFSLHAGVAVPAKKRGKLEKLIRYVGRPAVTLERMSFTSKGEISYKLKRAYSDGTTHVVFSPMEFMEKLAALVPRPRYHLGRFFGVLAPHAEIRSKIAPKPQMEEAPKNDEDKPPPDPRRMNWARLLKRVFDIEIESCSKCGGFLKVIAAVTSKSAAKKILEHLKLPSEAPLLAAPRAPPQPALDFDFS